MLGTRMSALQAFKEYIAIRKHFNSKKYNYFESGAIINTTEDQLDERVDKSFFYKLSEEYLAGDLKNYLMANTIVGRLHPSEMEDVIFKEWRSRMHSLAYIFEQDLVFLTGLGHGFRPLFRTHNGKLPVALQALNGNHITIETICIINALTQGGTMAAYDAEITDTFVWKPLRLKIIKYEGWIQNDLTKLFEILKKYIEV